MRLAGFGERRALLDRAAASQARPLPRPCASSSTRPTTGTDELIAELVETGAVDSLDLKGFYKGTPVDVETDPELYAKLIEAFPDAWLEDPDVNDETRPLLEPVARPRHLGRADPLDRRHRGAALAPPKMVNSSPRASARPARPLRRPTTTARSAGSAPTAAASASSAPGRGQIQYLASLFHPDTPNDVAPARLQRPAQATKPGLPTSPLEPAIAPTGFRWGQARSLLRPAEFGFRLRRSPAPPSKETRWPRRASPPPSTSRSPTSSPPHQQYVGAAVYYDAETLPRLAAFFYRQALEEREHAMMMIQYLLDVDEEVQIPGHQVAADQLRRRQSPRCRWRSSRRSGSARRSTPCSSSRASQGLPRRAVHAVVRQGAGRGGRPDEDLLNVVERSKDNLLLVEDYIARESLGEEGADPTAPPAAGGCEARCRERARPLSRASRLACACW